MSEPGTGSKESSLSNRESPSSGALEKRRPIPGRGHCKSRKGCFSCKRRRVKCSEELPSCRGCGRLGLDCEYRRPPPVVLALSQISHQPPSPLRLEDLRFFHHFLAAACPSIPIGMDHIWHTVAAMSHEYEFLAHAILGLAAQHLTVSTASDFSVRALDHRISAISALNQALSSPSMTQGDTDAKFAAAIILTYQLSCMPDGMMDFLGMLRGWMVIQTTGRPDAPSGVVGADAAWRGLMTPLRTAKTTRATSGPITSHAGKGGQVNTHEPRRHSTTQRSSNYQVISSLALFPCKSPSVPCRVIVSGTLASPTPTSPCLSPESPSPSEPKPIRTLPPG